MQAGAIVEGREVEERDDGPRFRPGEEEHAALVGGGRVRGERAGFVLRAGRGRVARWAVAGGGHDQQERDQEQQSVHLS